MRIALYHGKSFVSRLIRWQTRSRYLHAAFLLDDDSVVEAWMPRVRHVRGLSEQHTPGTKVEIFAFNHPLTAAANRRLEDLALGQVGIPYDYRGIFRFLTRERPPHSGRRALFCSELVFLDCERAGLRLLERTEAWRVPPDWLARSPLLNPIQTVTTS